MQFISFIKNKLLLIFLLGGIIASSINALYATNYSRINFEHLSLDDGLLESHVKDIIQDSMGYMWFGTRYGVCRYDGLNFRYITTDNKRAELNLSASIALSFANSENGDLWIGTGYGLNLYDINNDKVIQFKPNNFRSNRNLENIITAIFIDSRKNTWIGSSNGVSRLIKKADTVSFLHYRLNTTAENLVRVMDINEDLRGNLWLATMSGLFVREVETDSFYRVDNKYLDSPISTSRIICLQPGSDSSLWIGGHNRLMHIKDPYTFNNRTTKYNINTYGYNNSQINCASIPSLYITDMEEDKNKALWICTPRGLIIIPNSHKPDSTCFITHFPNPDDPNSLHGLLLSSVYIDNAGLVWISSRDNGISIFDPYKQKFETQSIIQNERDVTITSMGFTKKGGLWLTSEIDGLFYCDVENDDYYKYNLTENEGGSDNRSICEDQFGNILFCKSNRLNGGIYYIHNSELTDEKLENNTVFIQRITQDDFDNLDASIHFSNSLTVDSLGMVWVTTRNAGVLCFTSTNDKENPLKLIKHYNNNYFQKRIHNQSRNIGYLYRHNENTAYLSVHHSGVVKLDIETGDLEILPFFLKKFYNSPIRANVVFIKDGIHNNLLIGTYGGGFIDYYLDNDSVVHYTDNISSMIVTGAVQDSSGSIWLSTNRGITQIKPNGDIQLYDLSDGLQGLEFNPASFAINKNNKIFFGGKKGLNAFTSESMELAKNKFKPNTVISDFHVKNIPSMHLLKRSKTDIHKGFHYDIHLKHNQNHVKIFFSALSFSSPKNNKYKFMLDGFDEEWQSTSAEQPMAFYTNLKGGVYTFKVYGANSDGVYNDTNPTTVHLHIKKPIWQRAYFQFILSLLVILAIMGIIQFRTYQVRRKNQILDDLVQKRTKQIAETNKKLNSQANELLETNTLLEERQQQIEEQAEELKTVAQELKDQRDKLEETNATKDKLFSIVAHDLKNPLNAILGFTELLESRLESYSQEKIKSLIGTTNIAAHQVYKLLENLLQWSRTQTGRIKFEPQVVVLAGLVESVFNYSRGGATAKQIELINKVDPQLQIFADQDMIETILRNLISNSIKYTENGSIKVESIKEGNNVSISVIDTGIGMDKNTAQNLFQVDKSLSRNGTKGETGTGLGLIICKEFIEYHGGSLNVSSEEDVGSTFTFKLINQP